MKSVDYDRLKMLLLIMQSFAANLIAPSRVLNCRVDESIAGDVRVIVGSTPSHGMSV